MHKTIKLSLFLQKLGIFLFFSLELFIIKKLHIELSELRTSNNLHVTQQTSQYKIFLLTERVGGGTGQGHFEITMNYKFTVQIEG